MGCHQLQNVIMGWKMFLLPSSCWKEEAFITGSSVHNCWVERAHRDVYAGILCFYAKLFDEMEKNWYS